jgi:hypothetical protein
MGKFFTDTEVEDILREVESTINNAAALYKSKKLSKAGSPMPPPSDDDDGQAPPMAGGDDSAPPMAGGDDAGPADDSTPPPSDSAPPSDDGMGGDGSGEAAGDDDMAPPMGGDQGQGGEGEQALEGEGQQGDELSDQELHQIYASMEPAELERHYMIVRSLLRDQYQKAEMSEKIKKNEEGGNMKSDKKEKLKKKVAEQEQTIKDLQKSQKEMEDSLTGALKAVELIAKPTRKAVVGDVQVLNKTEEAKKDAFSGLSKAEICAKLNDKVKDPSLNKSQRQAINSYVLSKSEEGRDQVLEILGGKK